MALLDEKAEPPTVMTTFEEAGNATGEKEATLVAAIEAPPVTGKADATFRLPPG